MALRLHAKNLVGNGAVCTVSDDGDRMTTLSFPATPNPTNAQIADAYLQAQPPELAGGTRTQLEPNLYLRFTRWRLWHETHAEAVARALPAAAITALLARRDAAWDDYVAALDAWRQAPP